MEPVVWAVEMLLGKQLQKQPPDAFIVPGAYTRKRILKKDNNKALIFLF